jgi:hypothetical protein
MTYGMNVYQGSGALTYSSSDVTWNQVDYFQVNANGSASNTYSAISGREVLTVQILIDAPPTDRKALAHTVSVSGTTVSASGGSENAYILVLMR